jgi:pimeloyl-ACP methyl ester carboxylesterase
LLLVFLVILPFGILPITLDRLDGSAQPSGTFPDSVSLKGHPVMPTQLLSRPGGTIAYDDTANAGPLVVCVPSMGDLRQEYRFLTPQLTAAGFRVITMDVRGHGESSVGWSDYSVGAVGSDIVALIQHLNAGPAFVIGTSMAGGASVWAAAEAPDLVAGQVLIDAFVRDHPAEQSDSFVSNMMIKAAFAGPWAVPVWSMYYKSLYPTAPPADLATYRGALKANLHESGRLAALKAMMAASKDDSEARLDAVHAPTFVVFGTKDPDFTHPAAEAQWLATRLNGSLLMVDGAGHYPHAEMPEQVGPAIVSFLQGNRSHA